MRETNTTKHFVQRQSDTVQALLFDLGGVLIDIDFNRTFDAWSVASGIAAADIKSRYSFDSHYEAHERGEITTREYFESLRASLCMNLSDAQFLAGWNALLLDEIPGVRPLLAHLQTRVPLYVFSNSNVAHQACWTRKLAAMLSHFSKVFVSSELGQRKPDAQAFMAISSAIGIAPGNIMFFDDTRVNIAGAQHVGMQAVLTRSAADIESALANSGIF